jgi:hypothetical protein
VTRVLALALCLGVLAAAGAVVYAIVRLDLSGMTG